MGDLLFNRRHPYVDKSAGANMGNWIKVLDKAVSTFSSSTQFVCSHSGEGYDVPKKRMTWKPSAITWKPYFSLWKEK